MFSGLPAVLSCVSLQSKYDAAANKFAADTTAAVLEAVKTVGDAGGLNEKQLKQLAMPFAKYKMDEALKGGAQVRLATCQCVLLWRGVVHASQISPAGN